ncbi:hypothetical protein OIE66_39060 [Nonomuraea sp. NBC_01738]|uniref:hypothetical protein n=1 Tax=Nonomuraea sp. NBC_01738 TaxID=2976003 RepID=UPI002E14AEFB|nr:hypothetical protein OIE66_39060 [Nonomuraea sp. NBC_01738]
MDEDIPGSLRARWRERSLAAGWSMPRDWWTPAVEHAIKAVNRGHDLVRACSALGDARARAGVGIAEGMADLSALFVSVGLGEPPYAAVRSFAVGWTEASFAPVAGLGCEDPLTGLVTVPYLRTRLAELYRASAAGQHRLVVAEPYRRCDQLAGRLAAALALAGTLREAFPGGETLAQLAPARVGALARAGPGLPRRVARLREFRVGVRTLPERYEQALTLVRTLSLGA